ncbi:hypothetical protein FVE85_8005 [Porphyridium purpureum]|uniref:Uncharacterized protein n=1 Tax=Porphyridium purpureum TaxID=35688 RepID=A0A5J4YMM5_PORPP|nr:hypothetical protein FVE85_8005 [Porphyridium purpureum]|eukprot:POR9286..scf295_9
MLPHGPTTMTDAHAKHLQTERWCFVHTMNVVRQEKLKNAPAVTSFQFSQTHEVPEVFSSTLDSMRMRLGTSSAHEQESELDQSEHSEQSQSDDSCRASSTESGESSVTSFLGCSVPERSNSGKVADSRSSILVSRIQHMHDLLEEDLSQEERRDVVERLARFEAAIARRALISARRQRECMDDPMFEQI